MRRLVPLLLLAFGCTRGTSDRPAPTNCTGQVVAIVTNNLRESIDIHAVVRDRTEPRLLGSVNGGERREFVLPSDVVRVYPYISSLGTTHEQRERIHTRYECRS
jgi:hypothetical protein